MFERICTRLSLHTKAARIIFFSTMFFILTASLLGLFFLNEPPARTTPASLQLFDRLALEQQFSSELGDAQGATLYGLVHETVAEGDRLLQGYHFWSRRSELTIEEATQQLTDLQENWARSSEPLLQANSPLIRAVAEDVTEALTLSETGFSENTPFLNPSLIKARGMFHDLNQVLLAKEKSDSYYGHTQLGQILEKEARP